MKKIDNKYSKVGTQGGINNGSITNNFFSQNNTLVLVLVVILIVIFYINNESSPKKHVINKKETQIEIDTFSKDFKIRERKTIKGESIPEIYNMDDIDKQKKINYSINKAALYFLEGESPDTFDSVGLTYEIVEENKRYINILFNLQIHYKGAVTIALSKKSVLVDMVTGNSIQLKDLFKKGYELEFLNILIKSSESKYNYEDNGCEEITPNKITGNEDFIIKHVNIEINYDNGEIGARACGIITKTIPLKDIKHLVNPNGILKYLI